MFKTSLFLAIAAGPVVYTRETLSDWFSPALSRRTEFHQREPVMRGYTHRSLPNLRSLLGVHAGTARK